jgi:hypothetical protein
MKSNTLLAVSSRPATVAVCQIQPRCSSGLSQSYSPTEKVGMEARLYTAIHFA